MHGRGVAQDLSKAFEWFLKAAENGDTDSMYNVAECYLHGRGVAQDLSKAFEWRSKAEKPVDEKELLRDYLKKNSQFEDAISEQAIALLSQMGLI